MADTQNNSKADCLMKNRSYRAIIAAGAELYFSDFSKLFNASWLTGSVYALAAAALDTLSNVQMPAVIVPLTKSIAAGVPVDVSIARQYVALIIALPILALAAALLNVFASASLLAKLKEHKETGGMTAPHGWFAVDRSLMWRNLKSELFTAIIVVLPIVTVAALLYLLSHYAVVGNITALVTMFIVTAIMLLLSLPLIYTQMKYVLNPGLPYWSLLRPTYAAGLRHWGRIFTVTLLVFIVTGIILTVACLPSFILAQANSAAQTGLLNGDPLGMPSYMTALAAVTFAVIAFVAFYLRAPLLTIAYYLYGSIESYENEKKESLRS